MMAAAPSSKCPPAVVPAALSSPPRRLRCRCCEDTLGVPRRRASPPQLRAFPELQLLHQHQQQAEEPPLRPRRIVLLRHGESEGNVDEAAYTRVPDPQIGLTAKGWRDADDCGRRLRDLFSSDSDDWKVYFYVSPYRRTLETLRGMGRAFETNRIAGVREEPRLREQDFGNFQDREQMRLEKQIRRRYGRFFYRFPNGESAADVYDRITGFRETLRGDIDSGKAFVNFGARTGEDVLKKNLDKAFQQSTHAYKQIFVHIKISKGNNHVPKLFQIFTSRLMTLQNGCKI